MPRRAFWRSVMRARCTTERAVEGGAAGGLLEEDPAEAVRRGQEDGGGGRRSCYRIGNVVNGEKGS